MIQLFENKECSLQGRFRSNVGYSFFIERKNLESIEKTLTIEMESNFNSKYRKVVSDETKSVIMRYKCENLDSPILFFKVMVEETYVKIDVDKCSSGQKSRHEIKLKVKSEELKEALLVLRVGSKEFVIKQK